MDPDTLLVWGIGTGSCLAACPEQDILGIRGGQAVAVTPANCIVHGACERNCPVDAIQLVFGSAKRGVDIPRIKETFETNVQGLPQSSPSGASDKLDLVIVGCGPAGLSAALTAKNLGLNLVVLERENVGGTVRHYPRKKLVMTEPVTVPGFGKTGAKEILKEELIEIWEEVVDERDQTLPNNRLFVFAGGELPTPFLERCGVKVDTRFGER